MKKLIILCVLPLFIIISTNLFSQQDETAAPDVNKPFDKDWIKLRHDKPSSVSRDFAESNFKVYPNPNTGSFTVQLPPNTTELKIYSVNGDEVYAILPDRFAERIPVDISELGSGIYFVCITADEVQRFYRMAITR